MTNLIIRIVVAIVVFLLIFKYLLPLLPPPFGTIVMIALVIIAIIWLINLVRNQDWRNPQS